MPSSLVVSARAPHLQRPPHHPHSAGGLRPASPTGAPLLVESRGLGHHRLVLDGLHHHHSGEDDILWPALLERAAPSTGLVETMQAQHDVVDGYAEQAAPLLDTWESTASATTGTELADVLDRFAAALFEHLDLEEREILPLVERHVTVAEWNSLGEHGIEEMDKKMLPILFGAILEDATPDERRALLAKQPLAVRVLLRVVGARQYRRFVTRVRGR